jgi:hypothetical protein
MTPVERRSVRESDLFARVFRSSAAGLPAARRSYFSQGGLKDFALRTIRPKRRACEARSVHHSDRD